MRNPRQPGSARCLWRSSGCQCCSAPPDRCKCAPIWLRALFWTFLGLQSLPILPGSAAWGMKCALLRADCAPVRAVLGPPRAAAVALHRQLERNARKHGTALCLEKVSRGKGCPALLNGACTLACYMRSSAHCLRRSSDCSASAQYLHTSARYLGRSSGCECRPAQPNRCEMHADLALPAVLGASCCPALLTARSAQMRTFPGMNFPGCHELPG